MTPSVLLLTAALSAPAVAQETVDIGVLKNDEISVVQNVLYPKAKRLEIGVALGWLPFDPLVTTPKLELTIDQHLSEVLSASVIVGGGYGLKTARFVELESPAYGATPYAFRYLAGVLGGVEYAPIYAKMAFSGTKVVHFDVYGTAHIGATLEQSVVPGGGISVAPTLALGLGMRFFVNDKLAIRFGVRDDLLVQFRQVTNRWHFKQNGGVTLGVSFFGKAKGAR
jgi:outer membrane beta-barrel protein